jgi:hypothetical protein
MLRKLVCLIALALGAFGSIWLVTSASPARGQALDPFYDDLAEVNVRYAAELDEAYALTGDASDAYAQRKSRYDDEVRRVYLRHGRPLPPHLHDSRPGQLVRQDRPQDNRP